MFVQPCARPIPHGVLLTLLALREEEEHVCFADSDIFATAPFAGDLERQLETCDAFTSCSHFVADPEEQVEGFGGRCLRTPTGVPLPATFLAVYKAGPLRETMRRHGVGFERIGSGAQLDDACRRAVEASGWSGDKIDTAKLLGVMLHQDHRVVRHQELPQLLHIGGISWWLMKRDDGERTDKPFVWSDRSFARLLGRADRKQSREVVARFFSDHLRSLHGEAPRPVLKLGDAVMRERVEAALAAIDDAWENSAIRS